MKIRVSFGSFLWNFGLEPIYDIITTSIISNLKKFDSDIFTVTSSPFFVRRLFRCRRSIFWRHVWGVGDTIDHFCHRCHPVDPWSTSEQLEILCYSSKDELINGDSDYADMDFSKIQLAMREFPQQINKQNQQQNRQPAFQRITDFPQQRRTVDLSWKVRGFLIPAKSHKLLILLYKCK